MVDFVKSYGRPIQGVSRQPPKVRSDGQCTEQINCTPSVIEGLLTRVGSHFITEFDRNFPLNSMMHTYHRDKNESYIVILDGTNLPAVFDLKGRKMSVTGDASYLAHGTQIPTERYATETIGDYTFIANRAVGVKPSSEKTPVAKNQAVVTVAGLNYGRTYTVYIDGEDKGHWTAPDGSAKSHINKMDTFKVATTLKDKLVKDTSLHVIQEKNYLFISKKDGSDFKIETKDGAGGEDLIVAKKVVDSFNKIPARAPTGMLLSVQKNGASDKNILYLKATATDGNKTLWEETTSGGITKGVDASTMPHILVRESVDEHGIATFTFKPAEWEDRTVGNDESNPLPSFIDKETPRAITSIGLFQNRLFVTSGENLIMSRTDSYFDFFRYTAKKAVATDPIDVFSDTKSVNHINSSAILSGNLVLLSDEGQFGLSGNAPQTKETATLKQMNSYKCKSIVRPVTTGENLYFAYDFGMFAGVRELYAEEVTATTRARPVTEHVENYMKGSIISMAGSTNVNTMFVMCNKNRSTLYVYDWLWVANEKVQSAWHKWEISPTYEIIDFKFIRDTLYVVSTDGAKTIMESFDVSAPKEYGLDFDLSLDRQYISTFTFNKAFNRWESDALKFKPANLHEFEVVMIDSDADVNNGTPVPVEYNTKTNTLSTEYPLSDNTDRKVLCVSGEIVHSLYEPTPALLKDYQGKVSSLDKPTLGVLYFNFDKVGYFDVVITDLYGDSYTHKFNNRRMGAPNNIVGFAPLTDFSEKVPIRRLASDVTFRLVTASHVGMQLRDIEWTGVSNPTKRKR